MAEDPIGNSLNCNRRDFLKYAGIGVAAMSIGDMAFSTNAGAASMANLNSDIHDTDVLIIGGGVTATFAAVKARAAGAKVTLVDKGYVGRSGLTPYWHGFCHFDPKTATKEEWRHGLMWATESISRMDYIDLLIDDSEARWNEIRSWVPEDKKILPQGKGPYLRGQIEKSGTEIIEGVMITELLEKDGKIIGAIGIPRDQDKAIVFRAGAVVLCTGAGTFKSPGWPASPNTFDGHIMAYKAGAEIAGKEWNDFHMTNTRTPADTWGNCGGAFASQISSPTSPEAHSMRQLFWSTHDGVPPGGPKLPPPPQGAAPHPTDAPAQVGNLMDTLDTNKDGKVSLPEFGSAPPVFEKLDTSRDEYLQAGELPDELPRSGPGSNGPEVVGAALGAAEHRMDGIFPKDDQCWSGLDGLYAAGDAMCTGGVGTAGSSSPGCAVQGALAGINAAAYAKQTKRVKLSQADVNKVQERIFAPRSRETGYSPQWVTSALRNIMTPYYVLYVKRQDRLEAALTNVNYLKEHFLPRLIAKDIHELRLAVETENMVINAEMKLRASLFRKESRHSHFREDYPFRDDKNFLSFVVLKKDGDKMDVSKWDIPQKWIPKSLAAMPYETRYSDRYPGEAEYLKKHRGRV
jgi:succinate dehydrogenase/fumarate reductase flavoprotein subunit